MGKIKIKLLPNGSIHMETEGIKGEKCLKTAEIFKKLTNAEITRIDKTEEYYQEEVIKTEQNDFN